MIDNLDMGLAIFSLNENEGASNQNFSFKFRWCNNVFETLFECQSRAEENLNLKIFKEY